MPHVRSAPLARHALVVGLAGCLAAACSSPPDRTLDLTRQREVQAADALRRENFAETIVLLDKVLREYRNRVLTNGRADREAISLERWLVRRVASLEEQLTRAAVAGRTEVGPMPIDLPPAIREELEKNDWQRPIAVAALGFSENPDTLDPILNALDDPETRTNALFALTVRRDRRTPAGKLGKIIRDESLRQETRTLAASALYEAQTDMIDQSGALDVWESVLSAPIGTYGGGVLIQALRGIGLSREPKYSDIVAKYAVHPEPQVRMAVCVALARLGDVAKHETLLTLLDTTETNPNVRLAARLALKELAGGEDRKYDVDQWRRVFDLGG